jgi:predicted ATPase
MLGRLHIFHERIGDYHSALEYARLGEGVAREIGDPAGVGAAHSLLGIAHHLIGDQSLARRHLDDALSLPSASERIYDNHFGFYHRNRAGIALARNLWLQGFADQAQDMARSIVEEAEALNHPISLCIALIWAVSVFLWSGDLDSAEDHIAQFMAHADKNSLQPYNAAGQGVRGQLLVKRGRFEAGIALINEAQRSLHAARYALLTTAFNSSLAEALLATRQLEQALAITDETMAKVERGGDMFYMPELLRIKADILAAASPSDPAHAKTHYQRAVELARGQFSIGWELRAAMGLAVLLSKSDRHGEAKEALAPVHARFTEGFQTADLKKARKLLDIPAVSAAG